MCSRLRSFLLAVVTRIMHQVTRSHRVHCDTDSHANSILYLPSRGNRSFVSVSLTIAWSDNSEPTVEAEVLSDIKNLLTRFGIRQG